MQNHTSAMPARPIRATIASAGLLLLATGLAADLTVRKNSERLNHRLLPHGWTISFRPPRGFAQASVAGAKNLNTYAFLYTERGVQALLTFEKLDGPQGVSTDAVAEETILDVVNRISSNAIREKANLGPFAGSQVHDQTQGIVVRAAQHPNSNTNNAMYVVTLYVSVGALTPDLYDSFDLTCLSIEPIQP